jgi:opacity protein-like surface antigen
MSKMRTMLLALTAGLAISSAAFAGDIASPTLKALASTSDPCTVATASTPLSCSGPYIGGGLGGQGSNANIIGSGINGSLFAGGMTPTLDAGYQYAKGNWVFAAEFDGAYSIGSAATIAGAGANINGLRFTEIVKVGGNLSGLLGTTQQPITIPASLANAVLAPYVGVGQTQWQLVNAWANGTVSAAGLLFDVGPQWFGDLRYTYTDFSNAKSQGITIQNDQSLLVTMNRKF